MSRIGADKKRGVPGAPGAIIGDSITERPHQIENCFRLQAQGLA
jgi:hypothetical protein